MTQFRTFNSIKSHQSFKQITALFAAAALTFGSMGLTAFAATETRTKITSIGLEISSSIDVGEDDGDVSVTATSDYFTVDEVTITNDDGDWESGDVPRVKIYLDADTDYYFSTTSSSAFKLTGDDATFVSASTQDSKSVLVLTIKLDALIGDLEVDNAQWEDSSTPVADWEEASGAKSYQLKLYRGSSSVNSTTISTTDTSYDFGSLITKVGDYTYKVRAVYSSSKRGSWTESDSFYVDSTLLASITAGNYTTDSSSSSSTSSTAGTSTTTSTSITGPGGTTTGSWQQDGVGWWYQYTDGTYPVSSWLQINGFYYYFNSVGYMKTGWIQDVNGNWYYCDTTTGALLTNATTPDGYYVNESGIWVS